MPDSVLIVLTVLLLSTLLAFIFSCLNEPSSAPRCLMHHLAESLLQQRQLREEVYQLEAENRRLQEKLDSLYDRLEDLLPEDEAEDDSD